MSLVDAYQHRRINLSLSVRRRTAYLAPRLRVCLRATARAFHSRGPCSVRARRRVLRVALFTAWPEAATEKTLKRVNSGERFTPAKDSAALGQCCDGILQVGP